MGRHWQIFSVFHTNSSQQIFLLVFFHPGWEVLRTLGLQTRGLEPESGRELA